MRRFGIRGKLLLPIIVFALVLGLGVLWYVQRLANEQAVQMALDEAKRLSMQLREVREYYTKNVVAPASTHQLEVTHDYARKPGALPLPATMIHELNDALNKKADYTIRLYSKYPFPHRQQGGPRDSFEEEALDFLQSNPHSDFWKREAYQGREVVRYARADLMVSQTCVQCHNTHPSSPKTDWKLGDVRGALELIVPIDHALGVAQAGVGNMTAAIGLCLLGVVGVMTLLTQRLLFRPLKQLTAASTRIAAGDIDQTLDYRSSDEMGVLANAFRGLVTSLKGMIGHIGESTTTLSAASEELSATATQLGANAEETSAQASLVSAAAEQVSKNVQTVATGTEEMSISIKEIARSAQQAAGVATEAVRVAQSTNSVVGKLGDSSAEIGKVIKVITSIAEQTNLLALNATIEAARAGEVGKGFGVVAHEVKELAKETAKATEEISQKIAAIQTGARGAVEAIAQIGSIIHQIHDYQSTIASAVEEQTATTNEISRNLSEAAQASANIAQNITGVAQAAQSTSGGAADSQRAAAELARMATALQRLVAQFRYERKESVAPRHDSKGEVAGGVWVEPPPEEGALFWSCNGPRSNGRTPAGAAGSS